MFSSFSLFAFSFKRSEYSWATVAFCFLFSLTSTYIKLNDYSSFFFFFQQALTFRVKREKRGSKKEAMKKTKRGKKIAHTMSVSLKPEFKDVHVDSIDSSFVNQKKGKEGRRLIALKVKRKKENR